ncbi:MAG: hypothetical protein E5Y88_27235 [Mesorhizobium sp.]|uniref:hypothetical protein n=1 Tax=Mesorhizobium sp. TaxID=1871066 RepID=UPI000FE63142|nr:hypothetical protein [Mesorhizobium sp.]RWQ28878.1 MAG: hypothetical protein EOS20_33710 [Mesorhizobium sp.]TIL22514.1 MAG: hypothetical protein E5Y88_27235 [Mesorhizobium sp.]
MDDSFSSSDHWFDPWATSEGPHLASLSAAITTQVLQGTAKRPQARIRQPRTEQVERVTKIVSCLVANLAVLHQGHPEHSRLAIPLRHTSLSRYDRKGFGHLPHVIDAMAVQGLVVKHAAHIKKRRTGIEATGSLLDALLSGTVAEVGRAEGEETIWLTARMGRDAFGHKLPYQLVDYVDTPETCLLRREIEEINAFLATQRIELQGQPQAGFGLSRRFLLRDIGDPHTFDLHGRLYGGFWQSLPRLHRADLRINGEPIADLDFASMFPRLAYARIGAEPPEGDLYAIPGLEGHRAGVKAGFAAMLSSSNEMTRLPSAVKDALPVGWTGRRLAQAIGERHPALVPLFGKDIAMDLMFTESCILVAVLLRLTRMGIAALPMHDGVMVQTQHRETARELMKAVAATQFGLHIPVFIK